MGEQDDDRSELLHNNNESGDGGGGKRKFEDAIQLAKQKAQEIASRLFTDAAADPKRLRHAGSDTPSFDSPSSAAVAAPPSYPAAVSFAAQPNQYHGLQSMSKKISIPNGKVGVVIGKGGDTIRYIQMQSGAKIQITKDQDSDPHSLTRDVELMGTPEQISRAEQLINDVIAEADTGGSTSSTVYGMNTKQSGGEQFSMTVPNDKVGLLIGKGGETIKYMQSKSGARMQIIPLQLRPGETLTERTVYINGSAEQIEAAKDLVNDVINGKRILNSSGLNSFSQLGNPASGNWNQPGQPPMQQMPQYAYTQPGYLPTPPSYYGNYNQQPAWDQSNPATVPQPPTQTTGYGYYGQQQYQPVSSEFNPSYSYSQTPGANIYEQGYSQQPSSYGQNISSQAQTLEHHKPYATSDHGMAVPSQPDGTISSQGNQPATAYPPPAYNQSRSNPQIYWNSSNFTGQHPQIGYDQTGYSQAAYDGVQPVHDPPSNQPVYGQGGYPLPQSAAPHNYVQGAHHALDYGQTQVEKPPQSESQNNDISEPVVKGSETVDGSSNSGHVSNPTVQEVVPSQG